MPKLSSTKVLSIANDTSNSYDFLESDVNVELYSNSPSKSYQDWVLENVSQVNIINATPITIYQQETNSTCGSACVRMILKKHNIIISESDIKNTAHSYNPNDPIGYTYVFALVKTLNYYLESAGVSTRYTHDTFENIGVDYYTIIFGLAVESNQVIQILFKHPSRTCSNTGFPYYSIDSAHYVLLAGMKSAADGSNPYACVSDPYYTGSLSHSGIWEIPMTEIYDFSQTKGAYLIFENN